MRSIIGSILFFVYVVVYTPIHATLLLLVSPFISIRNRYVFACWWNALNIRMLRLLCGVQYNVEGMEHLPNTGAIILAKHQSAWETFAIPANLLPQHLTDPLAPANIAPKEQCSTLHRRHQQPRHKPGYLLLN